MKNTNTRNILVIALIAVVSFLLGWQINRAPVAKAQARPFQYYKVIKLDPTITQLILADQMNQYAEMGYRYRDSRDGVIIMEYTGK